MFGGTIYFIRPYYFFQPVQDIIIRVAVPVIGTAGYNRHLRAYYRQESRRGGGILAVVTHFKDRGGQVGALPDKLSFGFFHNVTNQ